MLKITGKNGEAIVYTTNIDETTQQQVKILCDQPLAKEGNIKIMPDCHAGAGSVIGTTMKITDKVVPNLVGKDIGCGVITCLIGKVEFNEALLKKLDDFITSEIPSGFNIHSQKIALYSLLSSLKCWDKIDNLDQDSVERAIGTLGGGNHFIEVGQCDRGIGHFFIHTGSRNLGFKVANYYQNIAKEMCKENSSIPSELAYLTGDAKNDYLHDIQIIQRYATANRLMISNIILQGMGWNLYSFHDTMHNYIDKKGTLRKGAIKADEGEIVSIPINMRDGVIIATGKGNPDWNNSAPHGAGRILSRGQARRKLKMQDFEDAMQDVFSTSVKESTLDESPFAYKSIDEIIQNTKDTIEIINIVKPIYNYKHS